jgi:predicted RNase H-like HicB family nuclease
MERLRPSATADGRRKQLQRPAIRSSTVSGMGESRTLRLTASVTHEDEWYVARCLEVEVTSQGDTVEQALANLREALELYFEDLPAPDIHESIVAPVEVKLTA